METVLGLYAILIGFIIGAIVGEHYAIRNLTLRLENLENALESIRSVNYALERLLSLQTKSKVEEEKEQE